MQEKEKIYCFDFDGTLTTKDTLLEFIKYAKGKKRFLLGFLLHSPLLVLMKLHLYPNWKAKQKVFQYFFDGMSIQDFDQLCQDFAHHSMPLLRKPGIQLIRTALSKQEKVFIVSASIDNWVRPFFTQQGLEVSDILGTQIEVVDDKVTGRFKTNNCYGEEKVHRICEALTKTIENGKGASTLDFDRTQYYIEAYGDSRGDKEMLFFADKGHYQPFRTNKG